MSGHSKWAQIKRQKGASDVRRGQTFTKVSNAITIAVRQGGGITDPDQNFRLRIAIEKARAVNMPKANIDRAINRAAGKGEGDRLEEIMYEGFGPHGVAVIVETATDNKLRTLSLVKNIFDKAGGTLGKPGSVSYQFKQVGKISVLKHSYAFDELFAIGVDNGAEDIREDVTEDKEIVVFITSPASLSHIRNTLQQKAMSIVSSDIVWEPVVVTPVNPSQTDTIVAFVEQLEGLDDVLHVYTNIELVS